MPQARVGAQVLGGRRGEAEAPGGARRSGDPARSSTRCSPRSSESGLRRRAPVTADSQHPSPPTSYRPYIINQTRGPRGRLQAMTHLPSALRLCE